MLTCNFAIKTLNIQQVSICHTSSTGWPHND